MKPADAVSIGDLARLARRRLPRVIFDYLDGGAEDEATLAENRAAFGRLAFRPKVLPGTGTVDLAVELFGERFGLPFLIGPTGLNGLFWPEADLALARAASAAGTGLVGATPATSTLERIAASTTGPKWFQLYCWGDRAMWTRLIERARVAGFTALVVTVDSQVTGKRERDLRHRFAHEVTLTPAVIADGLLHPGWLFSTWLPRGMPRLENVAAFAPPNADGHALARFVRAQRRPDLSWDDLAWIAREWGGPMLVKGILRGDDAQRAREIGAQGVIVSNHGGRQLDGARATIDALPEVVDAVGDAMTVLMDGGIRRGSDVVKALALGARALLLGRAALYGVAAAGEAGVSRALQILREEVARTLALVGCPSAARLTRDYVVRIDGGHRQ